MLFDGASGLLLVLGISVVLNVVVFMYFRNKTTALENKVDVMFNIVQEHAAINQRQQQMAGSNSQEQFMNQTPENPEGAQENNDGDERSDLTQPDLENPNLISVSDDDETDDDSDDESEEDSDDESEEELENTVIENQPNNDILSNGEVISIDQTDVETIENVVTLSEDSNIPQLSTPVNNSVHDDIDDSEDSEDSDDDSDDDSEHGNGEQLLVINNDEDNNDTTKKLLNIDDIEEVLDTPVENPTMVEKLPELPPNLKKMTVQQLKELVMQRFPDRNEEDVGKMKKKDLLSLLKG